MKEKKIIRENHRFILDRPYEPSGKQRLRKYGKNLLAIWYNCVHFVNRCLFEKRDKTNKRYSVSICAIFKDEARVLKEWIEYHKIVGVDHFYMYNNESSDGYYEILKPYIDEEIVTLIDWPGQKMQMPAYENCIEHYSKETDWMGFIDLDEFIVPIKYDSVQQFLNKYRKQPAVLIYWKVFGSSGLYEQDDNKLLIEQFFMAFPKLNDIGKCFYNTNYKYSHENPKNYALHHILWTEIHGIAVPPVNYEKRSSFSDHHKLRSNCVPIQINHYVTKSYMDYYRKTYEKTDVYFETNPRDMDQLYRIDMYCYSVDYTIMRFLSRLKKSMNKQLL